MKNKYIEPLISLLIVGVVFAAAVFVIMEAEEAFDEQISASVSKPIILEPRIGIVDLLAGRARERLETVVFSDCFDQAYEVFEQNWNQECSELGLEEKCSLPRYLAEILEQGYQEAKEFCSAK